MTEDRGTVYYGGIEYVELEGNELVMRSSAEAASELDVEGRELRLRLEVSEKALRRLVSGLRRVLRYGILSIIRL